MDKKIVIFLAGILFFLNVFCWQEVFSLQTNNVLKVVYLDVGQGDSAFIETPEKHQILIDGGPNSMALNKLPALMPFFDKTIDLVILTHPEKDHMQGLIDILQRYKADYILWTGVVRQAPEYEAWLNVLENQKNMGAKIIIAEAGQEIKAGNLLIDTFYPFENLEGQELKNTSNDASTVSKLIYGNNSFLFTGDISEKAEKEIVNSGENIKSDVLKVSHHGSKYSTTNIFLEAVMPKYAIIEVGKNSYGHPTPETLQRLDNFGVKTLRTDQNGDIIIITNGQNLIIK